MRGNKHARVAPERMVAGERFLAAYVECSCGQLARGKSCQQVLINDVRPAGCVDEASSFWQCREGGARQDTLRLCRERQQADKNICAR